MEVFYIECIGFFVFDFNCGELKLEIVDIDMLEQVVKGSVLFQCEGGFFYGYQFQDEVVVEFCDYDFEFCVWVWVEIV